ncbi:hypothetical protein GCM10018785_37840 [Streptomyces longispororuber]|uniref:Uncharacterized protein n=1 Tax=Streptomyces longispororuber TaxID=68230 RepID=A0A919DN53_9ACTN|nr:hypothetical protein GCM10018785_37840 [Streptomyces longispororuber]
MPSSPRPYDVIRVVIVPLPVCRRLVALTGAAARGAASYRRRATAPQIKVFSVNGDQAGVNAFFAGPGSRD